ncbi:MAG: divergent PAP2 family protein [Spirochaeta sp.]|nr:divergent PAP2 family protein [Spirochaeta sp.]
MSAFYQDIATPVFLSTFFSWMIAQLLKAVIGIFRGGTKRQRGFLRRLFWATGGMPSSHSALVTALATSIGFKESLSSPLFAISFFYAILTIRDALGVRMAAGTQARVLNQLIARLSGRLDLKIKSVKEVNGHTVSEVSVGILLGFFIAVAFSNL